jgi:hypothetical protein
LGYFFTFEILDSFGEGGCFFKVNVEALKSTYNSIEISLKNDHSYQNFQVKLNLG